MLADASIFMCCAAEANSLVRGAAKPWLLGLLGIGIGIELGWRYNLSDADADADADGQALSV
jgi:hypothetical protein